VSRPDPLGSGGTRLEKTTKTGITRLAATSPSEVGKDLAEDGDDVVGRDVAGGGEERNLGFLLRVRVCGLVGVDP
jgi:hypothetical protein